MGAGGQDNDAGAVLAAFLAATGGLAAPEIGIADNEPGSGLVGKAKSGSAGQLVIELRRLVGSPRLTQFGEIGLG